MGPESELLGRVRDSVLKPLEDLESMIEGAVESILEPMGLEKPKLIVTLNEVSECSPGEDGGCRNVTGRYRVEDSLILVNYKSTLSTIIHLLIHHIQSLEEGRSRYIQSRRIEELKLPWELRRSEIIALVRTPVLMSRVDPRVRRMWSEEIKLRIREIEENTAKVRSIVSQLVRHESQLTERRYH